MNPLRKTIKICLSINAKIYALAYFMYTFSMWKIENPFKWITDLPTYTVEHRLLIIFFLLSWWIVLFMLTLASVEQKDKLT